MLNKLSANHPCYGRIKKKKKNLGEIPTRRSSVAAVVYQLSQHCADKKREKGVNIMYPCIRQGARHLTS